MTIKDQEAAKVKEVKLPRLFNTHRREDVILISEWHVRIGEIIQPNALLLTVDTPPGICDIFAPLHRIRTPHRVCSLAGKVGEEIHLGNTFITLEPASE